MFQWGEDEGQRSSEGRQVKPRTVTGRVSGRRIGPSTVGVVPPLRVGKGGERTVRDRYVLGTPLRSPDVRQDTHPNRVRQRGPYRRREKTGTDGGVGRGRKFRVTSIKTPRDGNRPEDPYLRLCF